MQLKNISSIDLNLLKVLYALSTERHLTKAGDAVGLSQPAMSHALRRLRDLFEDDLFVRTHNGMEPTSFCLTLAPRVRDALNNLDVALGTEREFNPENAMMTLRVGLNDMLSILLLPALLKKAMRVAPEIDIRVINTLSVVDNARIPNDPYLDLDTGRTDLAVVRDLTTPTRFVRESLFSTDYVCVGRQRNPVFQSPIDVSSYNALEHVMVSRGDAEFSSLDTDLKSRGLQRRVKVRVPLYSTAQTIVSETDLVQTMPRVLLPFAVKRFRFKVSELPAESPTREYFFVWHKVRQSGPMIAWLRSLIRDSFKSVERSLKKSPAARAR